MLYDACVQKCSTWRKYFVILGGIFIYLPIGVPWYFGNLATYINSYYRDRVPSEADLVDPQWIFSAFFVAFSLAIIASGYIANQYGPRLTVTLALIIHSGATFASFYAIQHSMGALIATFGAVGGLGAGLAYGPPLPVVIKWMPRRVGLASGALMTGFGGGAVFYNELVTFFINPDNIKPDVKGKFTTYFSQPEILKRVPELFLVLGALTVVLQMVGVIMLRAPREGDAIDEVEMTEIKPIVPRDIEATPTKPGSTDSPATLEINGTTSVSARRPVTESSAADTATTNVSLNNGSSDAKYTSPKDNSDTMSMKSDATSMKSVKFEEEVVEMTPMEVLKTRDFYVLWLALAFNHYGYIIKNNYYKEYGQLRIDNDHFLTTTGTVATIGVSLARIAWGLATDWLGTKLTMLVFMTCTVMATGFWYFSLMYSPGLYMFWVIVVSAVFTGAFILFPLAALRCFGEKHYASNYGLILSSQIVLNLISPPIIKAILTNLGWFWLFFSIALANAFGTVALLFLKESR